jgi:hypothetical protein
MGGDGRCDDKVMGGDGSGDERSDDRVTGGDGSGDQMDM